jgi:Na+/glutamate symporter
MNCLIGYENWSYSQGWRCFCQRDGDIKGKRVTVVVTGLGDFSLSFLCSLGWLTLQLWPIMDVGALVVNILATGLVNGCPFLY